MLKVPLNTNHPIIPLARVTDTPVSGRKIKGQGHTGQLNFRIDDKTFTAATITMVFQCDCGDFPNAAIHQNLHLVFRSV